MIRPTIDSARPPYLCSAARRLAPLWLAALAAVVLAATGCASAPGAKTGYDYGANQSTQRGLSAWFDGDEPAAREVLDDVDARSPVETLFAAAEVDYWDGDAERAFERYVAMVQKAPEHPLNRFAAARLYALRDDVADYHRRMVPVLAELRYDGLEPLARVYLALVGQEVAWQTWDASETQVPFDGDAIGFPTRWMTTPKLSPWRLRDFERSFAVEDEPQLGERYRSPLVATDAPVNVEETRPYRPDRLTLSPGFQESGIYYLETFATVAPTDDGQPRDYWVYGSFPSAAAVWIGGIEVLRRTEGDYGTNKRLRRVSLAPGTHRVLVKLAYQASYRDWFDLAFVADDATPLSGSGLRFTATPDAEAGGAEAARASVAGDQRLPADLEPVAVRFDDPSSAKPVALYLAALAGYLDLQPEVFQPAFDALVERHPDFAAAWALRSHQVQTLWEIPSRTRDSISLTALRRAQKLAPESIDYAVRLGRWLSDLDQDDREVRRLLEAARDRALTGGDGDGDGDGEAARGRRLRSLDALTAWATYLGDEGWSPAAEDAWRAAVEAAPADCYSARQLQILLYERHDYRPPAAITAEHGWCPALARSFAEATEDVDTQVELARREASRYPLDARSQLDLADALEAAGKPEAARAAVVEARDRTPWELDLWNRLADMALADQGVDAAVEVLEAAIAKEGRRGWLVWRLANLTNDLPLTEMLKDGRRAALADVEKGRSGEREHASYASDEAYYVIDYAVRKYFADGSAVTLTHTLVRAMTKGAIDRFAELQVPGDARLLLARTIKQDGSVQVPEQMPGKTTLSMPALAEGDFVETAYLQYESPSAVAKSHREGIRFFFRMGNISSRHSEYVIIADDGQVLRQHGAPETERIDTPAGPAMRFLREDSPRPREEPHTVAWAEFLPWVQYYRIGTTLEPMEYSRRSVADRLADALKMSPALSDQIEVWLGEAEPVSEAAVRALFYGVASWFPDPSPTDFGTEAAHAVVARKGSPVVVLQAALEHVGVASEIYLAKSRFAAPQAWPIEEFGKYARPVLRVEMPDGRVVWLEPDSPDAMFDTVGLALLGQPAVCVTCEAPERQTIPAGQSRKAPRDVAVTGQLDADGRLVGEATLTFHGVRAAAVRSVLRQRTDETSRSKYVDLVVSGLIPGATLTDYQILAEGEADQPLVVVAQFERDGFARKDAGGRLVLEAPIFREPIASAYAELSQRTTPMLVRYDRTHRYELDVALPDGFEPSLRSQSGSWTLDGAFGQFERTVEAEPGRLKIAASMDFPIQRVQPDQYRDFQRWAVAVEQSSLVLLALEPTP